MANEPKTVSVPQLDALIKAMRECGNLPPEVVGHGGVKVERDHLGRFDVSLAGDPPPSAPRRHGDGGVRPAEDGGKGIEVLRGDAKDDDGSARPDGCDKEGVQTWQPTE